MQAEWLKFWARNIMGQRSIMKDTNALSLFLSFLNFFFLLEASVDFGSEMSMTLGTSQGYFTITDHPVVSDVCG